MDSPDLDLVAELEKVIEEAVRVIGDGDNGPPPFYADIYEKLETTLENYRKVKE